MSKLTYKECLIDVGVLGTHAEAFQELHAKISGRAGEFGTIAKPVSTHFGGLVGESLKGVATENHEAWSSSMMACIHAYGIIQKVISDVEWYEEEIESIKADLASALGALPSTGDELEDASIRNAAVIHYNELADEAWRKLEKRCETTEERLGEGPTPENIQELIAAGHIGSNLAYATTEDIDYFYFEESDAVTMANFFKTAVEGHGGSIDALDGQLVLLNALVLKALQAQQNGEKLSDNEIDFLEALFAELEIEENQVEQLGGGSTPQDFLDFIDSLNESEHIDDRTKEDINSGLASSMLILSDESLGGGYESIPDSIREVVEGPELPSGNHSEWISDSNAWAESFNILGEFLSSSSQGVKGGTDISVTLMATSARMLSHADAQSPYVVPVPQGIFGDVIEVAARNEDANYVLITGSLPDEYGSEGENYKFLGNNLDASPEWILERLYSFDWDDGGKAISNITDWIPLYNEYGDEREKRMAGHAAHALIEVLTVEDGDGNNKFRDTGVKGDGGHSSAVTELNPELAASLGSIYISYLDSFSVGADASGYLELDGNRDDIYLFHKNGDEVLVLPDPIRQDFLQLLVANEDLAPNIIAATESQERRIIEVFLTHPEVTQSVGGREAARLRTILDDALIQEYVDRGQDVDEAIKSANNQWQTGYNVFTAVTVGLAGSKSNAFGVGAEVLLKILEQPMKDYVGDLVEQNNSLQYIESIDQRYMETEGEIKDHAYIQMLDVMVSMDLIDMKTLEEEGLLIEEEDGSMRLPATVAEWGIGSDGYIDPMRKVVESESFENDDRVKSYIDYFVENYSPKIHQSRFEV